MSILIPIHTQDINNKNILLIATKSHPNHNVLQESKAAIPMTDVNLSEDIYHYFIDTSSSQIYLRTREMNKKKNRFKPNGHIASLDLTDYKHLWQDRINYNKAFASIKNRYMVRQNAKRNVMIDLATGEELWEVKNKIYYTFSDKDVAIGYKLKGVRLQDKQLQGLDMKTGRVLWERELDGSYGWREMFALNDSTLIISGSGIHSIHYDSGRGWSIEQTAGKTNVNLWTGTKNFYNLGSNIVLDTLDDMMYQAAEELLKFDTQGQVKWKISLPEKTLSKMYLWLDSNYLYLLNTGGSNEATLGYAHIGKAYTMCIDKSDGQIVSHEYIKLPKKDYIYQAGYVENGHVHAISKKKIHHLDIKTGEVVNEIPLLDDQFGKSKGLITVKCYEKEEERFVYLLDRYDYGIINRKEQTLHFISESKQFVNLELKDIYIRHELITDSLYLYHSTEQNSFITDNHDTIIAELDVLHRPVMLKNKLYSSKENTLRILDLESIK